MFWHTVPKALEWLDGRSDEAPWFMVLHGYDAHRPYVSPAPFYSLFSETEDTEIVAELVRNGRASEQVYDGVYYPDSRIDWFNHPSGSLIMDPDSYENLAIVDSALRTENSVRLTASDIGAIQAHYDTMLAYADLQLGLFLADVERNGHLEDTVIIVTGDHGEDLLDHEFMNHRTSLYDSSVRVPMIVFGPGFPAGRRVSDLVSAIDVVPTILDVTGHRPVEGLRGRSMQSIAMGEDSGPEAVYIEGVLNQLAVRTATHKLVVTGFDLLDRAHPENLAEHPINAVDFTLVDVLSDPGERIDLLLDPTPEDSALAESLRADLVRWRQEMRSRQSWTDAESLGLDLDELDPSVIRRMQDAGYWEMEIEGGNIER